MTSPSPFRVLAFALACVPAALAQQPAPPQGDAQKPNAPQPDAPKADSPFDHMHIYGDVRLRWESNFVPAPGSDRHRARMRVRVGMLYDFSDEVQTDIRVRTGNPDDPRNPNVDLGNGFDTFDVGIDTASIRYTPKSAEGLWLEGGKFKNPILRTPIYGELVWDGDVNPEGAVAGYDGPANAGPLEGIHAFAGWYALLERSSGSDASIVAAQVAGDLRVTDHAKLRLAVSETYYSQLEGDVSQLISNNRGNALTTSGMEFLSDYSILHPFAILTTDVDGVPVSVSGEWMYNFDAADGVGNSGFAAGVAAGDKNEIGTFYYQYQRIEQDAVFTPFAQDDYLLGTDFQGHVFGWKHKLEKWADLHLWASAVSPLEAAPGMSDDLEWRCRIDFVVSF